MIGKKQMFSLKSIFYPNSFSYSSHYIGGKRSLKMDKTTQPSRSIQNTLENSIYHQGDRSVRHQDQTSLFSFLLFPFCLRNDIAINKMCRGQNFIFSYLNTDFIFFFLKQFHNDIATSKTIK